MATVVRETNTAFQKFTGAIHGTFGIALDLVVASLLLYVLAHWVRLPPYIDFLSLSFPIHVAVIAAAGGYFWLSSFFSVNRSRHPRWAAADVSGTSFVLFVLLVAAASFHPFVAAVMTKLGLPVATYDSVTMTILVFFTGMAIAIFYVYHLKGEGASEEETSKSVAPAPRALVASSNGNDEITGAQSVVIHGNVDKIAIVADPGRSVRLWRTEPEQIDYEEVEKIAQE